MVASSPDAYVRCASPDHHMANRRIRWISPAFQSFPTGVVLPVSSHFRSLGTSRRTAPPTFFPSPGLATPV